MDTGRKTGTLVGVVNAAWDLAAEQAKQKAAIRRKLVAGEDAGALDLMRAFLGCPKPIVREEAYDVSNGGNKEQRRAN